MQWGNEERGHHQQSTTKHQQGGKSPRKKGDNEAADRAGEGGRRPHLVARVHNKGFTTINKGDSNGEGSDNADNLGDKAK